jgi:hypothetical protein
MNKYKENLYEAIEAAEEKYGFVSASSPLKKRKDGGQVKTLKSKSPKKSLKQNLGEAVPKLPAEKFPAEKPSVQKPPAPQDLDDSTDDEVDELNVSLDRFSPTKGIMLPVKPSAPPTSTIKHDLLSPSDEFDKENTPDELSPIPTPPAKLVSLSDANSFPKPGWSRPDASSAKISKVAAGDDDWLSSSDEEAAPACQPSIEASLLHAAAQKSDSESDSDDSNPALLLGRKKKSTEKPPREMLLPMDATTVAKEVGKNARKDEGWMKNDKTVKRSKVITTQSYSAGQKNKGKSRSGKRQKLDWSYEMEELLVKGYKKHEHLHQQRQKVRWS